MIKQFNSEQEEFYFAAPGGSIDPGGTGRGASDDDSADDGDLSKGGGSIDPGGTGRSADSDDGDTSKGGGSIDPGGTGR